MEFHEIANLYPLMQGKEFDDLCDSIRQSGQINHIILFEGKILDGRNRYNACEKVGLKPVYKEYTGDTSPDALLKFVRAENEHRRHLTSGQMAAIGVSASDLLDRLFEEAKKRKTATLKQYQDTDISDSFLIDRDDTVVQKIAPRTNGEKTRDILAGEFNTNRQYVQDALKIKQERPDLLEKVKDGEISITQAKREITKDRIAKDVKLPTDKYRVIYADPPWKYGNTMPDYFTEQADHYPLMTVKEVAQMPIKDIALENSVLFLWVTSPILEESFEVINSWGFKYKSSFVWDKIKHNMGHYNSVRHELLLICVRGSCQPDVAKLFDSVVSIERTGHSEKPEFFREIIDTIYPNGKRIELFARKQTNGWDGFGNEL